MANLTQSDRAYSVSIFVNATCMKKERILLHSFQGFLIFISVESHKPHIYGLWKSENYMSFQTGIMGLIVNLRVLK
jgi:hypothetical protein